MLEVADVDAARGGRTLWRILAPLGLGGALVAGLAWAALTFGILGPGAPEPELVAAWEERYGPGGRATTVLWIQIAIAPATPPVGATRVEVRALREAARAAQNSGWWRVVEGGIFIG